MAILFKFLLVMNILTALFLLGLLVVQGFNVGALGGTKIIIFITIGVGVAVNLIHLCQGRFRNLSKTDWVSLANFFTGVLLFGFLP